MQSPRHYQEDKERKGENGSRPTTATIGGDEVEDEEQQQQQQPPRIGDKLSSSTAIKNKKRVHYPHVSEEQPLPVDTVRPDCLHSKHERSSSGTRRAETFTHASLLMPLVDLYSTTENGSLTKPTAGDHVIPIEDDRCCGCCSSPSIPFRRRLHRSLTPWREFVAYQSNWSWVILVAAFLTYSIGEALTSVFPILFVALRKEFSDQGSSDIALVQSMMNALPCLAGPIASITTTRFGYRKTAMLGGMITSVSLFATSFVQQLQLLYITMGICYAIGNSLVLVATIVAVTEHFEAKPSFASGVAISGKDMHGFGCGRITRVSLSSQVAPSVNAYSPLSCRSSSISMNGVGRC